MLMIDRQAFHITVYQSQQNRTDGHTGLHHTNNTAFS